LLKHPSEETSRLAKPRSFGGLPERPTVNWHMETIDILHTYCHRGANTCKSRKYHDCAPIVSLFFESQMRQLRYVRGPMHSDHYTFGFRSAYIGPNFRHLRTLFLEMIGGPSARTGLEQEFLWLFHHCPLKWFGMVLRVGWRSGVFQPRYDLS